MKVETASRFLAARQSRRSFLARLARVAILVAGGPTLAAVLTGRAEARVCGQSGVAPKCPTYDCNGDGLAWGYCWYASPGCCAAGGLKKICDCCKLNHPFVHGYCPSGHNVYCIVESCWADPRVQTVPLVRLAAGNAVDASLALSRLDFGRGSEVAVLGDALDPVAAAVAAPLAAATGAPLLLTERDQPSRPLVDELRRLGATRAVVFGPAVSADVDRYLGLLGFSVERVAAGEPDLAKASVAAARWVMERTATRDAWATDAASGPAAGAAAATLRQPLVVGADAARELGADRVRLVGPELAPRAGDVPGALVLNGSSPGEVARAVADHAVGSGADAVTMLAVPANEPGVAAGLSGGRGLLLLHDPGSLDPASAAWVRSQQPRLRRVLTAGGAVLGSQGVWELQSAANHFDAHRLIGVAGQGLPVISQPLEEREMGRARLQGTPAPDTGGRYWVGRANPDRHR